jgi:hypothetical protein
MPARAAGCGGASKAPTRIGDRGSGLRKGSRIDPSDRAPSVGVASGSRPWRDEGADA